MRILRTRTLRGRLLIIVAGTVLVVLIAGVMAFNLLLHESLLNDARTAVTERAESAALSIANRVEASGTAALLATGGTETWVQVAGVVRTPTGATAGLNQQARTLLQQGTGTTEVRDEMAMLGTAPILVGEQRVGTVVASISLTPYDRTARHALIGSLALAIFMLLLVVAITAWALRSALRPFDDMTHTAASWTQEGSTSRFNQGDPVDEVGALAQTLDQMLDRIQASLRHERRITAEVSHELRTPLARIVGEADLALRQERSGGHYQHALAGIRDSALQMDSAIGALLASARDQVAGQESVADAVAVARQAAEGARSPITGPTIVVTAADDVIRTGVNSAVLARILGPLVENAVHHGHGEVAVHVGRERGEVYVIVRDDGPGVPDDERESIFEPGVRGSAATGDGSGLGLALARRLARSANGDVRVEPGSGGRFKVRLPAA